jgi:signal peptidase I
MKKIYKSRYVNALKKAAKINRYLKNGYHVFHDGRPVTSGKFILRGDELLFKSSDTFYVLYYQNHPDWDHGYWTTINKWNKEFTESFDVYQPSAKVKL